MHNRDIGIDLMKGLLMTLVVYVHTARTNSIMIDWFNTYKLAGFFIVSGLLLCSRGGNISVWRCIRRIIIPYFVFSFAQSFFARC